MPHHIAISGITTHVFHDKHTIPVTISSLSRLPDGLFQRNMHHSLPLFSAHLATFELSSKSIWIRSYTIFSATLVTSWWQLTLHVTVSSGSRLPDGLFQRNMHQSLPLFSAHLATFELSSKSIWIRSYTIFSATLVRSILILFMPLFPPVLGSLMDFFNETCIILFLSSARI